MLLLVHYFGFEDKNCTKIRALAKKNNVLIVEDYAHGLFTYLAHHPANFDYVLFSLHKMLPMSSGGVLLTPHQENGLKESTDFFKYDLTGIAAKRIENYEFLKKSLEKHHKTFFTFLRSKIERNVPQTLPILVKSEALRDALYFELNKLGFGAVSLYHELIAPIDESYKEEKYVSKHILNLPIHQDVDLKALTLMVKAMVKIARVSEKAK